MLKRISIITLLATIFVACGDKAQVQNLATSKDSLMMVVAQKDSIINDAFSSISEIAANIDQITQREKIVTTQAVGDLSKSAKAQINDNINAINELLEKNRITISRLQGSANKLKAANVKIEALQKLIEQLQAQIQDKDSQLAQLADKIKALNVEVAALGRTVVNLESDKAQLEGTVTEQENTINTVYYIIGVEKELVKKDIIDKKGFIGKTRTVSDNATMTDFTKSDARTLERIPVNKAKIKIVTNHPTNSYMTVMGDDKVVQEIVITDKEAFWSNSKILVVSHK